MMQSSTFIPGAMPTGVLGRLVSEASGVRSRLDELTMQASSGSVSDTFAGLAGNARTTLNLRPVMAAMEVWNKNIDSGTGRIGMTLTAMDRITAIASDFYARTNNLNGLNTTDVDTTAAAARDALRELAGLLNTRDGDVFIFAGQDSASPPVPNGDAILGSGFYVQVATAIGSLGGAGAAATIASTLAIAGSNASGTSPFSVHLSQAASTLQAQRPAVEVSDQRRLQFGIQASLNSAAVSGGSSTTGSYMRDLMRALATIGALSSSQIGDTGFAELVADTRDSLRDAITAMTTDAGILGLEQSRLSAIRVQSEYRLLSITQRAAGVEDVDMASVLSLLSQAEAQLQASYRLISVWRDLTLTRYLS